MSNKDLITPCSFWDIYSRLRRELLNQKIIGIDTWIAVDSSLWMAISNLLIKFKTIFPTKKKIIMLGGASALQKNLYLLIQHMGFEVIRISWSNLSGLSDFEWNQQIACLVSPREHEITGDYLRQAVKEFLPSTARVGLIFFSKEYGLEPYSAYNPWEAVVSRVTDVYFVTVCGERLELFNSYPFLDLAPFNEGDLKILINQVFEISAFYFETEKKLDHSFEVLSGRFGGKISGKILAKASERFSNFFPQFPYWRKLEFPNYIRDELDWLEPEELRESNCYQCFINDLINFK